MVFVQYVAISIHAWENYVHVRKYARNVQVKIYDVHVTYRTGK